MNTSATRASPWAGREGPLFPLLFGCFLGLTLLKFGNPPIMEKYVTTPGKIYEFVLGFPWPIRWAYLLLVALAVYGFSTAVWTRTVPRWLLIVPLVWLFWQVVATTRSVDAALSWPTLAHFVAALICFYLGFFCLRSEACLKWVSLGLLCGLSLVVAEGWLQHFGGLEETRRYFYAHIYPQLYPPPPPEYLKKMASDRIFGTLFYPNALAGALLLGVPIGLSLVYQVRRYFTPAAQWFLAGLVAMPCLACLYWSGSKGGWLLMLLLGLLAVLRLNFARRLKFTLVAALIAIGLTGFFWKYSKFFEKGATSVGARFDYWRAAVQTVAAHPVFGTGPGTFARPYEKLKLPQSEMTRLVHDDYLEQASDSGIPGFITFAAFVGGALLWAFPRRGASPVTGEGIRNKDQKAQLATTAATRVAANSRQPRTATRGSQEPVAARAALQSIARDDQWVRFTVWLGVLGWALQCFVEFSLYIPALAWLALTMLGCLLRIAVDNHGSSR